MNGCFRFIFATVRLFTYPCIMLQFIYTHTDSNGVKFILVREVNKANAFITTLVICICKYIQCLKIHITMYHMCPMYM